MSNYQAVIYPFENGMLPYFQPWTIELFKKSKLSIIDIVTPNKLDNLKDISFFDNRPLTGIKLHTDLHASLGSANTLMIPNAKYTDEFQEHLFNLMLQNISAKKNTLCGYSLSTEMLTALQKSSNKHQVEFIASSTLAHSNGQRIIEIGKNRKHSKLQNINAPIIFISDLAPATNGMDISLGIISLFVQKGYKVSAILDPGNSQLLGFHGWDELFAYDFSAMQIEEYVYNINSYFVGLDYIEKPNLMVIKLPKGPIPINEYESNCFGLYTYMISQAVNPDYFTLCLLWGNYKNESIFQNRDLFEKRFGHKFDSIHISNAMPDMVHTPEMQNLQVLYQDQAKVNSYIDENLRERTEIPIVNGLTLEGITQLCNHIEETLTSYTDYTSVI